MRMKTIYNNIIIVQSDFPLRHAQNIDKRVRHRVFEKCWVMPSIQYDNRIFLHPRKCNLSLHRTDCTGSAQHIQYT